jgi:hypothetical protein
MDRDVKFTVLSDAETPPSRPGTKFFIAAIIVVAGIAYLVFGSSIAAVLGFGTR